MSDRETPRIDLTQSWGATGPEAAGASEEPEFAGAGILPVLPPGCLVVVERTAPRWAVGTVDTIHLRDDRTLTLGHLEELIKYHGGGQYRFKAQLKGKWVKDGTAHHTVDARPLQKGRPHPNDPDRGPAPTLPTYGATPSPYQAGGLGSAPPLPHNAPGPNADVTQWMMQQIQTLQQQAQQLAAQQHGAPMGAPPHGYQAPPGYQLVPMGGPPALQNYGDARTAFSDLKQLADVIKMVREIDGGAYEEEEEEEETEAAKTVDGMAMPQNLEEAASAYVWMQMKEHEAKKKAEASSKVQTGPRLVRNGQTIAGPGAGQTSASENTPPPTPGEAQAAAPSGPDLMGALAQLKALPAAQQAELYLQVSQDLTSNPEVAEAIKQQIEKHNAAQNNTGAA